MIHRQAAGRCARLIGALALLAPLSACAWFADEQPPANAKPLSEIIKSLEDQGFKIMTEIEFEDGAWEIEVHQADGSEVELIVDAVSGAIVSRS